MKQRIITAIAIIAVALPVIIIGDWLIALTGLILTGVAISEMINMRQTVSPTPWEVKTVTLLTAWWVVFHGLETPFVSWHLPAIGGLEVLAVVFVFFMLIKIIRKSFTHQEAGFYLTAILYVGMTFRAMLYLRQTGLTLFLFMLIVVALADSCAYFAGRRFGKHKLAPVISPNKTIEGAIGGTLGGTAFGLAFGLATGLASAPILLLMGFVAAVVGQVGDLVASSLKREYQIKDFGKIFPGHGGVLDRLDSHLFASLAMYLVINLLNVVI